MPASLGIVAPPNAFRTVGSSTNAEARARADLTADEVKRLINAARGGEIKIAVEWLQLNPPAEPIAPSRAYILARLDGAIAVPGGQKFNESGAEVLSHSIGRFWDPDVRPPSGKADQRDGGRV
jgi:hypothetical protein